MIPRHLGRVDVSFVSTGIFISYLSAFVMRV